MGGKERMNKQQRRETVIEFLVKKGMNRDNIETMSTDGLLDWSLDIMLEQEKKINQLEQVIEDLRQVLLRG
jgi:hypothetical protein